MKIAVYPGTFDPITYGNIDVIKKALKIFDKLIIATTDNTDKNYFFSIEERIDIINNSLFKDLKFDKKKIAILEINGIPSWKGMQKIEKKNITEILVKDFLKKIKWIN